MGTRSDYEGFRYKPREVSWASGDHFTTNNALKREFENIGNMIGRLASQVGGDIADMAQAGVANQPAQSSDVLVKINGNDNHAGMLEQKLKAGDGIVINITDSPATGLMMTISTKPGCIVYAVDFNTNAYVGEAERLIFEFDHPIPNEYYLFDIYRPTDDTIGGSAERGRFQIRWKSIEADPYHFKINFHQPEFGTVVLIGSSAVQRG